MEDESVRERERHRGLRTETDFRRMVQDVESARGLTDGYVSSVLGINARGGEESIVANKEQCSHSESVFSTAAEKRVELI